MKNFAPRGAILILVVASLLLSGCNSTPHDHPHEPNGEPTPKSEQTKEAEPLARTEFSERLLNFFEFAPLKPQETSSFLIHLTDLKTGEPVAQGDVKLVIKGPNGKELNTVQAKIGRVTGIYVAEVSIPTAGTYGIDFIVKNEKMQETMSLQGFEVSSETPAANSEEEESASETISFLMEQQWLIDMKLAEVESRELAVPIHTTGRIIPAANSHARVSSPVGGSLTGQNLPVVGRKVVHDEAVATVIETATASEVAQVRAALAQVEAARVQTSAQLQSDNASIRDQNAHARIENARLEAEKKTLSEQLELSQAMLNQAKKESMRARKVHAAEGISARELQAVELKMQEAQTEFQQVRAKKNVLEKVQPIPVNPLLSGVTSNMSAAYPDTSFTLRAPFSGVVTEVHKSLGEQVAPGEIILEIANTRTVWLSCPIYEKDLGLLHDGIDAKFDVLSYPNREFSGTLVHLGEVINEKTRATDGLFRVNNVKQDLLLGMQAKVRISGDKLTRTLLIPKEAVLDREGKKVVYVLVTGEEFVRRAVTVTEDFGQMVGVTEGLSPGERVVTQGAYQLFLQETNPAEPGVHSHET